MTAAVDREEQVDDAIFLLTLAERLIEALVAMFSGAPNFVFDAAVNIVFRVGFDDEESTRIEGKLVLNLKGRRLMFLQKIISIAFYPMFP